MKVFDIFALELLNYVPLSCIWIGSNWYTALVIRTLGPILILVVVWSVLLGLFWASPSRDRIFQRAIALTLMFVELLLISISTSIFETWNCSGFDNGMFLTASLDIACDESDTRIAMKTFSLFMAFIFPIGLPCVFVCFLVAHHTRINRTMLIAKEQVTKSKGPRESVVSIAIKERKKRKPNKPPSPGFLALSILFEKYRANCYWYGVFLIVVRLLETSVLVFFARSDVKAAFATAISLISMMVQRELVPFLVHSDNLVACTWHTDDHCFFTLTLAYASRADISQVIIFGWLNTLCLYNLLDKLPFTSTLLGVVLTTAIPGLILIAVYLGVQEARLVPRSQTQAVLKFCGAEPDEADRNQAGIELRDQSSGSLDMPYTTNPIKMPYMTNPIIRDTHRRSSTVDFSDETSAADRKDDPNDGVEEEKGSRGVDDDNANEDSIIVVVGRRVEKDKSTTADGCFPVRVEASPSPAGRDDEEYARPSVSDA